MGSYGIPAGRLRVRCPSPLCGRGEETASEKFAAIYRSMQPEEYICLRSADPTELASKVNVQRISNSVIAFSETDLLNIYTKIVKAYS